MSTQPALGEINRGRLFLGCIIALVATAFGFIVRALILDDWKTEFNLSQEKIGVIQGAGLYPFAISIILFSLFIDRIGYGVSMAFAFAGHVLSAVITILSPYAGQIGLDPYEMLYVGTFVYGLANGVVEAVINPVTATMFARRKTHYLSILHAGWPGGLVLGGLLTIGFDQVSADSLKDIVAGSRPWQWKVALVLLPTVAYGILLFGQRFPVQERVSAGVSYRDMMREFGAGSCFIATFLLVGGIYQILGVFGVKADDPKEPFIVAAIVSGIAAIGFGGAYRSFGRPMFVFLLLVMLLLATTELGTDAWISDIMKDVLKTSSSGAFNYGALVLIYTSFIMFVLRFFAGPIVHRISPLGLLACSAAVASLGLLWLANVGTTVWLIFLAATLYGFGKTFFWPATLGVVSEQFPRGGALTLNAIAGVGMIAVGVLGSPLIGVVQDRDIDAALTAKAPEARKKVEKVEKGLLGEDFKVDQDKLKALADSQNKTDKEQAAEIKTISSETRQKALMKIAILPAIMFVCYLLLIFYFKARGGYKAVELDTGQ